MPPRKKQQPQRPLTGCNVAVVGTFPGTNHNTIQSLINSLGGIVNRLVGPDNNTTCLISTQASLDAAVSKVTAAQDLDVPIVSIDWLNDCIQSNAKVDVDAYIIGSTAANGKKRAASPAPVQSDQQPEAANKKAKLQPKFGEGSILKSRDVVVPLDEGCLLAAYSVYIADDGVVYDASLNQTNASNNNNKFYRIQLLHNAKSMDFKCWTRWGRVGELGQNAILGDGSLDDALHHFQKKFKDKSGLKWEDRAENPKPKKYAYVEKSYGADSDDDEARGDEVVNGSDGEPYIAPMSKLEKPVQSLVQLIFNQQYINATMTALNYDANKMPLGKLSKATIHRGFQTLQELADLFDATNASAVAIEDLSNRYYSLIPHDFGRSRPPVINNLEVLKKELEMLESLGDMKEAADLMKNNLKSKGDMHPLDRQFQGLKLDEMTVLDPADTEFTELAAYLVKTCGSTHRVSYKIDNIFRIERNGELTRFEENSVPQANSDRRLLWHGSRTTNFGGILSQGLRIAPPEAPVSGYMFGKGIYLADMSSKSANYCFSYVSGGQALLLLCEAELGNPMQQLTDASYNAGETAKKSGCWSTFGMGLTGPTKWKDAGCAHPSLKGIKMPDVSTPPGQTNVPCAYLQYNEYIVYDVSQVRLRYLFRVRM